MSSPQTSNSPVQPDSQKTLELGTETFSDFWHSLSPELMEEYDYPIAPRFLKFYIPIPPFATNSM